MEYMWCQRRRCGITAVMAAVACLGIACGGRQNTPSDYPPPGHMEVLSVENAPRAQVETNLIPNGDFSVWHAGAYVPEGCVPPRNREICFIVQRDSRGGSGENSVDQYWKSSDADEPLLDLFHCIAYSIQPDKIYEISVNARIYDNTTVNISLLALDNTGQEIAHWPDVITTEALSDEIRTYTAKIRTTHAGALAIVPHTNPQTAYRGRTIWLEWRLFESRLADGEEAAAPQPLPEP